MLSRVEEIRKKFKGCVEMSIKREEEIRWIGQ